MAIEIKELNVRLFVDADATSNADASDSGGECNDCAEISDKDLVVQQTVKEVLRILKEKQER